MPPSKTRLWALALYAIVTLLSFPQELPGGIAFDFGWQLAWFGPAALIVGIADLGPRRAAQAAFLASLASHALIFHWFFVVTVRYGGMPVWLGVLSPLLPSLYVSIFTALFAWCWTRFLRHAPAPVWTGAMGWVAVDWVRAHLMGGFPWATLGYALHRDIPLLGWTRWAGVYVLSFFAAAIGIAIARAWLVRTPATRRSLAVTVAVVAFAHAIGWGLSSSDGFESSRTIRIAAVQGNIDQGQKWNADLRDRILATYLRLSEQAADDGAEWIVWPETAVPGLVEVDSALRAEIGRLALRRRAQLVVGATGVEVDRSEGRLSAFFDSAFYVDANGRVLERYDKTHLVPFGEYVPLRSVFGRFFEALASGLSSTDISAGVAPRPIDIGAPNAGEPPMRAGVPICYELIFPHIVRHFADQGAGVLLAITNDAWYGRTGAPHQFLAMTSLRAAENARWVVRAANTGISAVIDARGRVRQTSALFEEAVVVADVPVGLDAAPTFYARFGDGFAGLCVVTSVLLFGRRKIEERRSRA